MQREEWAEIDGFPEYVVSTQGTVVNVKTHRELKIHRNQQGIGSVGLYSNRVLTRLVVGNLVAAYFRPREDYEENPHFNTVIYLNGDKADARVENLAWRPRWFAVMFHRQFYYPDFNQVRLPIRQIDTGEIFPNVKEICIRHGVRLGDVLSSCSNGPPVFPSRYEFEWVHEK